MPHHDGRTCLPTPRQFQGYLRVQAPFPVAPSGKLVELPPQTSSLTFNEQVSHRSPLLTYVLTSPANDQVNDLTRELLGYVAGVVDVWRCPSLFQRLIAWRPSARGGWCTHGSERCEQVDSQSGRYTGR